MMIEESVEFGVITTNIKKEFEEVSVSETTISTNNTQLNDYRKCDNITLNDTTSIADTMKTESFLFEEPNNSTDWNGQIKEEPDAFNKNIHNIEWLFCSHCCEEYKDYCTKCGMLEHILNSNTLGNTYHKAKDGIPNGILEIRESVEGLGIFSLKVIPKGTKFGPFIGSCASEHSWRIRDGKLVISDDEMKFLNWMQYINSTENISKQNLLVFQHEGSLYYRSKREIQKEEELLVCFADKYGTSFNKDTEMEFNPVIEWQVKDVFACTFCCLGFSLKLYLSEHKTICPYKTDEKSIVEELTRCQFCKIYLEEKEYIEYHMAYCNEKNDRSNVRVNDAHWTVLISYMQAHPSLATGKIEPNGKQNHHEVWEELSSKLNALGYGSQTPEEWQETWVDYKQNLKKKMLLLKRGMTATGGEPGHQKQLSEFEVRVLYLLGSTFCEGTGSSEVGLPTLIPIEKNVQGITGNSEEHNYSTKKRKRAEYEETIAIINDISNSVNRGLADINATLKELRNVLLRDKCL